MTVRGHQRRNRRHTPFLADRMGHSQLGWTPRVTPEPEAGAWTTIRDIGSSPKSAPETMPSTHNPINLPIPDEA